MKTGQSDPDRVIGKTKTNLGKKVFILNIYIKNNIRELRADSEA